METGSKGVRTPYLFRSYDFRQKPTAFNRNTNVNTGSFRLLDVCRATSAAPTHFKSLKIKSTSPDARDAKFRDGSDWSVNPSLEAYREITSMHADIANPIDVMLSVGCGELKRSKLGNMIPGRNANSLANWEDMAVERMMSKKSENKEFRHYYRLAGPSLQNDVDDSEWKLDGKGTFDFTNLRTKVDRYCLDHESELQACAEALVSMRRRRAETYQWEEFAFGNKYRCHICEEANETPPILDCRADFMDHLRRKHESPPETEEFLPQLQRIVSKSRTTSPLGVREPKGPEAHNKQDDSRTKIPSIEPVSRDPGTPETPKKTDISVHTMDEKSIPASSDCSAAHGP